MTTLLRSSKLPYGDIEAVEMVLDPEHSPNEKVFIFGLTETKMRAGGTYIRFSLLLLPGPVFIKNARVVKGEVYPPQSRVGTSYFTQVYLGANLRQAMYEGLKDWMERRTNLKLEPDWVKATRKFAVGVELLKEAARAVAAAPDEEL